MKRNFILIILLVTVISIVGCTPILGIKGNDKDLVEESLTISDYYPFLEDVYYDYEGIGNEFAEQRTFFEYIEGNRAQLKIFNPGTVVVKVLELEDDTLSEIYYEGEFYHIENMLHSNSEKKDILLKEPLKVGNTWSDPEGHKRTITGLEVEIDTPFKNLSALEVTTELGEGKTQRKYYAKDLGLVASIYEDENGVVKTLLKSQTNQPQELDIMAYYPLQSDIRTVYLNSKTKFHTNESVEKLLEDILKNPLSDKLIPAISAGTVINTIQLDRGSWILKVDFSKELLTEMNAGSSLETEILKSIVNTLGRYYDTDKVYITVEGRPYESGHYGLQEDENFKVDMEGIEKFK